MIVVESSELKRLSEICRVLAVDLNSIQDQEDYHYQRVQDLNTNTTITSLKIRSNDINVVGTQALTNMFVVAHLVRKQSFIAYRLSINSVLLGYKKIGAFCILTALATSSTRAWP